jgi:hypothetical protein
MSRWIYYFLICLVLVVANWIILPFLVVKEIVNLDLSYNLFSEIFGIFLTLILLVAIFEFKEEMNWRKVKKKVLQRICNHIRSLFIKMMDLVDLRKSWSSDAYVMLTHLSNQDSLTFSKKGKKILANINLDDFLNNLIFSLGVIEGRYYRFLEADLELRLMEIQGLLESLRNRIKENQEKELLETIHAIVREIYMIYEFGLDFWNL